MNNNGVCKKNTITGEIVQLYDGLSLSEALGKVGELRSKKDGNWYWIGKAANHTLLK